MKAFLINPNEATITEVDYNDDWKTIKDWLGGPPCDTFTAVRLNEEDDVIYVDDEGLINSNPHGWFVLLGYGQPLKGFGLVVGTDAQGRTVAPFVSLAQLEALVRFPKYVNEALIDRSVTIRPL